MNNSSLNSSFYKNGIQLVRSARHKIHRQINLTMVETYFEIGRMIIDNEQEGSERAEYGKQLLENLSEVLTKESGSGFSETNLRQMRKFFLIYQIQQTVSAEFKKQGGIAPKSKKKKKTKHHVTHNNNGLPNEPPIQQTLSAEFKLSWSHYLKLMRIDNSEERNFYEIESVKNN